jgi:hypothetical protein
VTSVRLLMVTPVYGATESASVTLGWAQRRTALLTLGATQMPFDLFYSDDLVRGRSRAADEAARSDATHVLWWDSDVVPEDAPLVVDHMLASGHSIVGAPYPVKRIATRFPFRVSGPDAGTKGVDSERWCVPVDEIGMGFMLTSVHVLRDLIEWHREELWFSDVRPDKTTREVAAIFQLMFGPVSSTADGKRFRTLDSEDYSFCRRARAAGFPVHMYVGPGAPLAHVGAHKFEARRDDMGKTR